MPGSGPPIPDVVLDIIRGGAPFVRVKAELGGIDVDGVVHRLVVIRGVSVSGAWALDPDAGGYMTAGTFAALHAWAISAERDTPVSFDEGQRFALGLFGDSVEGVPIVRVVVIEPVETELPAR